MDSFGRIRPVASRDPESRVRVTKSTLLWARR